MPRALSLKEAVEVARLDCDGADAAGEVFAWLVDADPNRAHIWGEASRMMDRIAEDDIDGMFIDPSVKKVIE
jgi:hypothetical protein